MTCPWTVLQLLSTGLCLVAAGKVRLNSAGCGRPDVLSYIVNGRRTENYQFPWMVHLQTRTPNGRSYACAGTVITELHVLTAAHCFYPSGVPIISMDVVYGNVDRLRGKRMKAVKKLTHPYYDPETYHNDIAVVKVERPFTSGDNVRPICVLLEPTDMVDVKAIVAGWGRLAEGGAKTHYLHHTSLRIMPHEHCKMTYHDLYDEDVSYCAYQEDTDTCQGDSGGPLFAKSAAAKYVQVGIISHGIGCAQKDTPGVYTRVDAFGPWLSRAVASDEGYKNFS